VGRADQEMVQTRKSYASQVPDEEGPAKQIDHEEHEKGRKATASDLMDDEASDGETESKESGD